MILVLAGTNRPGSKTRIIAEHIYENLKATSDEEVSFFSLEDLPSSALHRDMYDADTQDPSLTLIQDKFIIPSTKWILVSPEYNGSFSGVLKLFIDALSIRKFSENFKDKQVALVGVASGRAGNLRGMDHLTGFLNYLGMHIHPNKLPISSINQVLDENNVPDEGTQKAINSLLQAFIPNGNPSK